MTAIDLTDPIYHDEDAARAHLELSRWPTGKPTCPLCGVVDQARPLKGASMGKDGLIAKRVRASSLCGPERFTSGRMSRFANGFWRFG